MAKPTPEYQTTYGKRNPSGKTCTLQQLNQQSFMQKIISISWKILLILMILLCFYYVYKIDLKKESKDIVQATQTLSEINFDELYNETVQVSHVIKTTIISHVDVAADNLKQLDEEYNITNRIQGFWRGTVETLYSDGQAPPNIVNTSKNQDFTQQHSMNNQTADPPQNQITASRTDLPPYQLYCDL